MITFSLFEFNRQDLLPFTIWNENPFVQLHYVEYDGRYFWKTSIGFVMRTIN